MDLFKPGIFRRVTLGCSLQMWSQLSGMNIMMYVLLFRRRVLFITFIFAGTTWSSSCRAPVSADAAPA